MDPEEEPRNENPAFISHVFSTGIECLQNYGWFLLLGIVAVLYVWNKMRPNIRKWQQQQEDSRSKKYDSNELQQRAEAMMMARQKMQAELDAKAKVYAEDCQKKEELKRKQQIEDWERLQRGQAYRSKYRPPEASSSQSPSSKSKPSKPLRPSDYNPLTGDSSGFCYRPSRSTGGAGGG